MQKSADAFRTISEVAEDLDLPQHVLRFWETRFPQIRPMKRAGGRRYYRPADIHLLRTIRQLLYDDGYTIKGVQRLLKDQGLRGRQVGEPAVSLGTAPVDDDGSQVAVADESEGLNEVSLLVSDPRSGPGLAALNETAPCVPADTEPCVSSMYVSLLPDERIAFREALAIVEECEQFLVTLRASRS